jgi:hypothetical protein
MDEAVCLEVIWNIYRDASCALDLRHRSDVIDEGHLDIQRHVCAARRFGRVGSKHLLALLNPRLPVFRTPRVMRECEDDDSVFIGAIHKRKWEILDEYSTSVL